MNIPNFKISDISNNSLMNIILNNNYFYMRSNIDNSAEGFDIQIQNKVNNDGNITTKYITNLKVSIKTYISIMKVEYLYACEDKKEFYKLYVTLSNPVRDGNNTYGLNFNERYYKYTYEVNCDRIEKLTLDDLIKTSNRKIVI